MSLVDTELNIPGLFLLPDFVSAEEEQVRLICKCVLKVQALDFVLYLFFLLIVVVVFISNCLQLLILDLGLVLRNGVFNTMDMSFVTGQEMLILRSISASFRRLFLLYSKESHCSRTLTTTQQA